MNSQKQILRIGELLSRWYSQIKLNNAIGFFDINNVSEGLSAKLLNLIFKSELKDLNQIKTNYPGIDLGDEKKGICFQVTSRTDARKIKTTLEKYVASKETLKKDYSNGLFFLVLSFDEVKLGKFNYREILDIFDPEKHVINFVDLIKKINTEIKSNSRIGDEIILVLEREFDPEASVIADRLFKFDSVYLDSYKENPNAIEVLADLEKRLIPQKIKARIGDFEKIKTFLNPTLNPFYSVYYPLSISSSREKRYLLTKNSTPKLFEKKSFISILGVAGSGKSTIAKHLFLDTVKTFFKIPIFIELRNLNAFNGGLFDYILKNEFKEDLNDRKEILHEFFKLGKVLFILDGFDEIYSGNKSEIVSDIRKFVRTYSENKYVITSRPGTNLEYLNRFENHFVNELNSRQIEEFVELKTSHNSLSKRIIETISKEENEGYKSFLTNPLLLSMFIRNFEFHPELPQQKNRFYFNLFDTLYQRHDGDSKYGWTHEKRTGLKREEFEQVLELLSLIAYFEGFFSFSDKYFMNLLTKVRTKLKIDFDTNFMLHDLQVSISILVREGLDLRFPHRSLQEYFSAICISRLQTPVKKIIYSQKFPNLLEKSDDSFINFWTICEEVDKEFFYKEFLIPSLGKLLNSVNAGDDFAWIKLFRIMEIEIESPYQEVGQLRLFPEYKIRQKAIPILNFLKLESGVEKYLILNGGLNMNIERLMAGNKFDHLGKLDVTPHRIRIAKLVFGEYMVEENDIDGRDVIYIDGFPLLRDELAEGFWNHFSSNDHDLDMDIDSYFILYEEYFESLEKEYFFRLKAATNFTFSFKNEKELLSEESISFLKKMKIDKLLVTLISSCNEKLSYLNSILSDDIDRDTSILDII